MLMSSTLVACGSGSSDGVSAQPETPLNTLSIQGTSVDRTIVIDPEAQDFLLLADANQFVNHILLQPKNTSSTTPVIYAAAGFMDNQYAFLGLVLPEKNTNIAYRVSCAKDCEHAVHYTLSKESGKDVLSLDVRQQAKYTKLPEETPEVPVQLNGRLQFSFPEGWPVFQTKRFPAVQVGKLIFDNRTYQLTGIDSAEVAQSNGVRSTLQRIHFNEYKGLPSFSEKYLTLTLRTDRSADHTGQVSVYVAVDNKNYSASYALPQRFWLENGQRAQLNMNNLLLKDEQDTVAGKILLANLNVPKMGGQLFWNEESMSVLDKWNNRASAENDQKSYQINVGSGGKSHTLKITHELKGHLSLSNGISSDPHCGDRAQACTGLSVDTDQKTYRFNQVKFGNDVLNGSVYIPGVFE